MKIVSRHLDCQRFRRRRAPLAYISRQLPHSSSKTTGYCSSRWFGTKLEPNTNLPIAAINMQHACHHDVYLLSSMHENDSLTLDDDVAAKLKAETRRSGRTLKDVVNEYLRLGLYAKKTQQPRRPFHVEARDLGALRPGLSLDNVGDLLEQLEGPVHR